MPEAGKGLRRHPGEVCAERSHAGGRWKETTFITELPHRNFKYETFPPASPVMAKRPRRIQAGFLSQGKCWPCRDGGRKGPVSSPHTCLSGPRGCPRLLGRGVTAVQPQGRAGHQPRSPQLTHCSHRGRTASGGSGTHACWLGPHTLSMATCQTCTRATLQHRAKALEAGAEMDVTLFFQIDKLREQNPVSQARVLHLISALGIVLPSDGYGDQSHGHRGDSATVCRRETREKSQRQKEELGILEKRATSITLSSSLADHVVVSAQETTTCATSHPRPRCSYSVKGTHTASCASLVGGLPPPPALHSPARTAGEHRTQGQGAAPESRFPSSPVSEMKNVISPSNLDP